MADKDFRSEQGLVVNNNLIFAMGGTGRVGICTNAPQANLDINGTCNIFGNTQIGQNVGIGGTLTVQATTTINAPLITSSYATIGGQLDVKGGSNINGVLGVIGDINAGEDVSVTRDLRVGGQFTISGPVTFSNNFNVIGDVTIGGTLKVNGYTTIDDSMTITGSTQTNGNMNCGLDSTIGRNFRVNGSMTMGGNLNLDGAVTSQSSGYFRTSLYCATLGVGTQVYGAAGEIRATNDITGFFASDERLKENMTPLKNAKEKILSITGYEFDWKDDHIQARGGEDGYFVYKHDVGLSAQELEKVVPELVRTRPNGTKAVKYGQLIALFVEGYKEQQKEIDSLKAKLGV